MSAPGTFAKAGLWLVNLSTYGVEELPLSNEMRGWFSGAGADGQLFPCTPIGFDGHLRVPIGPMLVQGFHGWSSWFTRERVITCRQGRIVRDREVDTLAMLEWALRRREGLKQSLDPDGHARRPLWRGITDDDYEHLRGDWWPPEYAIQHAPTTPGSWFVSGTWFKRQ